MKYVLRTRSNSFTYKDWVFYKIVIFSAVRPKYPQLKLEM